MSEIRARVINFGCWFIQLLFNSKIMNKTIWSIGWMDFKRLNVGKCSHVVGKSNTFFGSAPNDRLQCQILKKTNESMDFTLRLLYGSRNSHIKLLLVKFSDNIKIKEITINKHKIHLITCLFSSHSSINSLLIFRLFKLWLDFKCGNFGYAKSVIRLWFCLKWLVA